MAGPLFYILVAIYVIVPMMIISRMSISSNKKFLCAILSLAIPIITGIATHLAVDAGLITRKMIDWSPTEKNIMFLVLTLIIGGPWLPLIVAKLVFKNEI